MAGKRWTNEEEEFVRAHWGTHTARDLATQLGRSTKAVRQKGVKMRLRKIIRWPKEVVSVVREMHAQGLTDTQIARARPDLFAPGDVGRAQVTFLRHNRLQLPANRSPARQRCGYERQLVSCGVRSFAELRSQAYRRYARESGWPEDLPLRAVQVLNVLATRGVPMTRRELAEAISPRPLRSLKVTGPLLRRGLLHALKRKCAGQGKGRSVDLYVLGPEALRILQERTSERQSDTCERGPGADAAR